MIRPETNALVSNFEIIPTVSIEHQGLSLKEMDLDAIIRRHPQIVLVDELAHTNAPGSRHVKRYQDVEEILQAGISVYTTVNIQHIESQNDAVAQIIGIRVSETVPDTFFSDADEIRLIDVTPEELNIRLKAGKVYVKDMAEAAVQQFLQDRKSPCTQATCSAIYGSVYGPEDDRLYEDTSYSGSMACSRKASCLYPSGSDS